MSHFRDELHFGLFLHFQFSANPFRLALSPFSLPIGQVFLSLALFQHLSQSSNQNGLSIFGVVGVHNLVSYEKTVLTLARVG